MGSKFKSAVEEQRQRILRTRKIRGACYEFQRGNTAPTDPEIIAIKEAVEALPGFTRWREFSITWNIDREKMLQDIDYFEITPLRMSLEEEWDIDVRANAMELPRLGHQALLNAGRKRG